MGAHAGALHARRGALRGPGLKREATMDYARTAVAQLDTLARFGDGAALAATPLTPLSSLCIV